VPLQDPIEGHLPLVRKIAADVRRTLGGLVDLDDLVAYGTRGLLEARDRFDPSRGIAFSTFAYYRIRGAIYDGVREMGWKSTARAERRQARFESRANLVLEQAADDAPAPGSAGELESIEGAVTGLATAWIVTLEADAGVGVADGSPGAEDRAAARSEGAAVRRAIERLPEKERRLLDLMYFEDRSLTEAAAAVGLSKAWACRLHARALKLLAEELARVGAAPPQRGIPLAR
jgi:RNA polymerase sigma factor for flagellar operon FliA